MLALGAVPVIGENDTVAVGGSVRRQRPAGGAGRGVDADRLLLLTDVEGLLVRIGRVMRGSTIKRGRTRGRRVGRRSGTGGMASKVGRRASPGDRVSAIVASGRTPAMAAVAARRDDRHALSRLRRDAGRAQALDRVRAAAGGRLVVDDGARRALVNGSAACWRRESPKCQRLRRGRRGVGDRSRGREFARGLAGYGSAGSPHPGARAADRGCPRLQVLRQVVHRDDLVLL